MDTPNQYQDGMPKVDEHGRNVVRVVANNEAGWRYVHEDAMSDDDKLYTGEIADDNGVPAKVRTNKNNAGNIAPKGEHVGSPSPAPTANLDIEGNNEAAKAWGDPS